MGITSSGQPLEFQLKLTSTFAQKLAPVVRSLGNADKALEKTRESVRLFEADLGRLGGKGGPLLTFDIGRVLDAAVGTVRSLVGGFVDLTKSIVKTAGAAQDLNLAVRLNVGEEGAKGIQSLADSFGNTRFDDDFIKENVLDLLDIGVRDETLLDDLSTAAADIAARRKGDAKANFADAMEAFKKIALKGEVDARALRTLQIGEADFFKNLGELAKTSPETAKKMAAAGKFKPETLLSVALDELQKRQGGGIGVGALEGGKTLGATLARLEDLSGNVFKKIADGPGMKAVQRVLDKFIELMQGGAGDKLMAAVDRLLAKIGEVLTPERLESFINGLTDAVTWVTDLLAGSGQRGELSLIDRFIIGVEASIAVLGALYNGLKWIADVVAEQVANFADLGATVSDLGERAFVALDEWGTDVGNWIADLPGRLWEGMEEVGRSVWQGLVDGITSGIDAVKGAIGGLGSGMIAQLKSVLGIASPSKVMAQLGGWTTEGFALGVENAKPRVESAARRAVTDTAMNVGRGGARERAAGGGTVITFAPVYQIDGAQDREALVREIDDRTRTSFVQLLEDVGLLAGAEPEAA